MSTCSRDGYHNDDGDWLTLDDENGPYQQHREKRSNQQRALSISTSESVNTVPFRISVMHENRSTLPYKTCNYIWAIMKTSKPYH